MFLGRVKGHIVATAKDPAFQGQRLLLVEPLKIAYDRPEEAGSASGGGGRFEVTGRAIVSLDRLGAGEGQLVLIAQGSSARLAEGLNQTPVDAVIVGIVDEAVVLGEAVQ